MSTKSEFLTVADNGVHIFDLSAFTSTNTNEEVKANAAADLLTAAYIGVFYLKGHGVSGDLIQSMLTYTARFHNLPDEVKNEIHLQSGGTSWRGYMPKGGEGAHGNIDHTLYLGNEPKESNPELDDMVKAGTPTFGLNRFPPEETLQGFKKATLEYIHQVTELGQTVMSALCVGLGLEEDYFRRVHTQPEPVVLPRLVKYDSEGADPSKDFGISAHSDFGFLTLLQTDDAGLQYQLGGDDGKTEPQWVGVSPLREEEGEDRALSFIVGIGDMLDRMTDGRVKSRYHRVLLSGQSKVRHSIPFFWDASWSSPVQPLLAKRTDKTEEEKAADDQRWSKTKLIKLTGVYANYLAAKVQPVFPTLIPAEALNFEGMKVPSSRFHIVPGEGDKIRKS